MPDNSERRLSKQEEQTRVLSEKMGQVQLAVMEAVSELALRNQEQHAAMLSELSQVKIQIATNYLTKDEANKVFAPASLTEDVQELKEDARFKLRTLFTAIISAMVGSLATLGIEMAQGRYK